MELTVQNITIEPLTGLQRKLNYQVPVGSLQQEIEKRLNNIRKTMRLPGFRPGKVPLGVVKQKYGTQVQGEIIHEIGNKTISYAAQKEGIRPIKIYSLTPQNYQEGQQTITFESTLEIYPEVKIKDLEKINIAKPIADVTEKDIDNMIETLRKQATQWKESKKEAKKENKITIDAKFSEGKKEIKTINDIVITLGDNILPKEIEDKIIGQKNKANIKETTKINKDYPDKDLADKKITFAAG